MVESLLSTLVGLPGSFPKSCLKQLFCRELLDACFCLKELHSRRYLKSFAGFSKHNTENCLLYTWNLLKGISLLNYFWKFSNIFKTSVRNLVWSSCLVALERVGCKSTTIKREFFEISSKEGSFLKKPNP